jgi:hypothetical protein
MFSDYSQDLLRSGIIEAKAGNREGARRYLDRALYMSSDHEVMAEAWYWLSQLSENPSEKRQDLENCLANNLDHARARRELAILDGKLQPGDVINPDNPPEGLVGARPADAQRLMCPRCGGRMSYSPDGKSLVCEYCRRDQALDAPPARSHNEDFVVAMATRRGQGKPLRDQVVHCQGCGARFILLATQLSFTCAYCGSPHVLRVEGLPDLVAPDRIVPHAFDRPHAADMLHDWIEHLRLELDGAAPQPHGLYLPVWTFSLGGFVEYAGEILPEGGRGTRLGFASPPPITDHYPVMLQVSIAASRKPSAPFVRLIGTFDMQAAQAYAPGFLAAWPAELYDVSMADASLEARGQAYVQVKQDLPARVAPIHLISTSSAGMTVETFTLDLLPVWLAEIIVDERRHMVLVNGQSGNVQSDILSRSARGTARLMGWLADLVGE